jgi:hypothetical protein
MKVFQNSALFFVGLVGTMGFPSRLPTATHRDLAQSQFVKLAHGLHPRPPAAKASFVQRNGPTPTTLSLFNPFNTPASNDLASFQKYLEKRDKTRDAEMNKFIVKTLSSEGKKRDDAMKKFIVDTLSSEGKKYAIHVETRFNKKFDQQTKLIKEEFDKQTKKYDQQTKKYDQQTKKYDKQTKLINSVRERLENQIGGVQTEVKNLIEKLELRIDELRKEALEGVKYANNRLEDLRKELNKRIDQETNLALAIIKALQGFFNSK